MNMLDLTFRKEYTRYIIKSRYFH